MTARKTGRTNDGRAEVLAIVNQKGGVGKSTTAVDLSAALGEEGKRCLVVDFDPQGNATSGYGVGKDDLSGDVYDALMNGKTLAELIVPTCEPNVALVPSTIQLAGAEIELVGRMAREQVLKDLVEPVRDAYDYIFIDCPPSLGLLTVNALVAATGLLIPIQCEYYALEGVTKLLESFKLVKQSLNRDLSLYGVILTMFDTRTTLSKEVAEEVRRYFGDLVFETVVPRSVKVSEAPSHGLPISKYAYTNKGAIAYRNLAREMLRHG